jgi:adenylate cyclase
MKFCPSCGTRMEEAEASAEPPAAEDAADESRVQLATVLFGDVKGFTAMSEDLPPEEVTGIMNECFDALTEVVVKYDGWVAKFIGDAIMTAFGWPTAHEDDPVRAIRAALEMQQALTKFAARLKTTRGFELAMRIGINSGQVFVARVGGKGFEKIDLMGNTVNLASRLEHEARPGSVLVGETTYRLAQHAFEFEAVPPMDIKGQTGKVKAYVPLGHKVGAPEVKGGGKLRLIGRGSELALLDTYLNEARAGQGRLVAVVADPGVGKSRLVEEFWKRHLDQGVARVYAAAPSFGQSLPYSMLSNFIRSLLFGEATDREINADQLYKRLLTLLPERSLNDAAALLDDVLGIEAAEETEVSQLAPQSRQAMLTNILKVLLHARSQEQQALLLTLEDLHWMDRASLDVLDPVLTGIEKLPVMVLLTHRPRFSHAWSSISFYRQISLKELSGEHARGLLFEFFGSSAIPTEVGERVIEKAGGNPFFLEQLLNNLVRTGAVVQEDGRWGLASDIASLSVPDTIQEILQARIDQLPRGARAVLQVAAVIGRVFAYRLLEAIAGAERGVQQHLQLLQSQEFVFEKSRLPELEYTFTHALTQDVVYHGLPEARRRVLHERVAQAIETLGISVASEQLALLAVHYEQTANREKALEYALAAGQWSRQRYANQDAVSHFLHALEILEQEPKSDQAKKLTVLEALGDLYKLLGDFEEAYSYYSRAREESTAPSDRARTWRKLGDLAESRARYAEALDNYREAEKALATVDDPAEQVNVWLAVARMDRSRGALEAAAPTCLRALSLASSVDAMTRAALYFELGEVERERGHLRGASEYLQAAEGIWDKMGSLQKKALVYGALADVAFNRGELAEALKHFERALDAQRRILDRHGMASTLYGIGRIRVAMGELDAAVTCYTEALAVATEIDYRYLAANCMVQLGTIYLERGDVERAQELIAKAYVTFKQMRNWRGAANAQVARARLLRAQGDPDHARTVLRRAWNLADEMNDPWLRAQVSISEAELEEETGRLDRSAERAVAGIGMARDLSDLRLVARGERILGRVRAREGRLKEALSLLSSSVAMLRRSGAQVDAARAALDYVIAAQGVPGSNNHQVTRELLGYAIDTFDRTRSTRDLQIAQMIAQRVGQEPSAISH